MNTDQIAHTIKNEILTQEPNVSKSWADILCTGRIVPFAVAVLLVLLFSGCSLFGTDISPTAKMAQKVATCIEKTEKVEQEIKGVGGDLIQVKKDIVNTKTSIIQVQNQNTDNKNENESLKSLIVTVSACIAGFFVLFTVLYIIIAKVAPGKTLWNILCPWRMVKK